MNGFNSYQNKHEANVVKHDSRDESELALCVDFLVSEHQNIHFNNRVDRTTNDDHKNKCWRPVLNLWFVHV